MLDKNSVFIAEEIVYTKDKTYLLVRLFCLFYSRFLRYQWYKLTHMRFVLIIKYMCLESEAPTPKLKTLEHTLH